MQAGGDASGPGTHRTTTYPPFGLRYSSFVISPRPCLIGKRGLIRYVSRYDWTVLIWICDDECRIHAG